MTEMEAEKARLESKLRQADLREREKHGFVFVFFHHIVAEPGMDLIGAPQRVPKQCIFFLSLIYIRKPHSVGDASH
jgi:hypothetical protein